MYEIVQEKGNLRICLVVCLCVLSILVINWSDWDALYKWDDWKDQDHWDGEEDQVDWDKWGDRDYRSDSDDQDDLLGDWDDCDNRDN